MGLSRGGLKAEYVCGGQTSGRIRACTQAVSSSRLLRLNARIYVARITLAVVDLRG